MKKILSFVVVLGLTAVSFAQLAPGDNAPDFKLKNIDGKMVSLDDAAGDKGAIVIFTCNTCPVVHAYEQRILDLDKKYREKGYPVIAINPNDPAISAGDSFEKMKERAKEQGYTFPYLFDEKQDVFPAYGATRTPHTFLVHRDGKKFKVGYIGAIDDNQRSANVEEKFLENAIASIETGNTPDPDYTRAVGCSIKFKK
jgi:peroxiredoxin